MIAAVAATAYVGVSARCIAGEEQTAPGRNKRDLEFQVASARFPEFCQHWQHDLRERERDNMTKLVFEQRNGFQTATYTGYGDVEVCEVHQSKEGFAIGKIVYEEFTYYLAGETLEAAMLGEKRRIAETRTTEIFRWENGKWFE